jgi:hypothetical protein
MKPATKPRRVQCPVCRELWTVELTDRAAKPVHYGFPQHKHLECLAGEQMPRQASQENRPMDPERSKHWQRLDELIAAGKQEEAARLQAAYEAQWFKRAKEGQVMNLSELIGGAETVHVATLDRKK